MGYLLISFSHKNSNIVNRDSISFKDNNRLERFMSHSNAYLSEIMILNTCNRIEFFAFLDSDNLENNNKAIDNLLHDISHYSYINFEKLKEIANIFIGENAIHHIFSVVSSLQSLVIGETQIVGQVKDAFRFAFSNGFARQNISRAVHYAFKCSAQVRSETGISQKKVSIASVAVSRAIELMGSIENKNALVIGAGEMSRLLVQYLSARKSRVTIINRTRIKAEDIAKEVGDSVKVKNFTELEDLINKNELLFTATSSENPIIVKNIVKNANFERWWFDLAVPLDIDLKQESLYNLNINLYRVDDLRESVEINRGEREEALGKAYRVIGEFTVKFFRWIDSLDVEPLLKNLYIKANKIANDEVEKAISKGLIPKNLKLNSQKLAESSLKKILHKVSKNLRKIAKDSSADMVIESINYLFDIKNADTVNYKNHEKNKVRNSYKCDYAIEKGGGDNINGF